MATQLTILGSNSAIPAHGRHPSAQVLSVHNELYLIDCGEGTQMQLSRFGIRRSKITKIFISHLHGDHIYGLPGLITSYNHFGRSKPLDIYGPIGLQAFIDQTVFITGNPLNFEFRVHEFDAEVTHSLIATPWVEVSTVTLRHRIPTAGFVFSIKNPRLKLRVDALEKYKIVDQLRGAIQKGEDYVTPEGEVVPNRVLTYPPTKPIQYAYFSDTMYVPELVSEIKDVDVLYHEATFTSALQDKAIKTMHSTAAEAAAMAQGAEVGRLIIGHFSSRFDDLTVYLDEARATFPNSDLAIEGQVYDIG